MSLSPIPDASPHPTRRLCLAAALPWMLSACGGGGGDGGKAASAAPAMLPMMAADPAASAPAAVTEPATYRATLSTAWSAETFATQFPAGRHFSGLVGATHDATANFWKEGSLASLGIKNMAERGQKTALLDEVAAAQSGGAVGAALSGGGIGGSDVMVSIDFMLTPRHPLVTLVSMVAPSPDWFVGVSGLSLQQDGHWLPRMVLALEVYDAGTDSGLSFASPDQPTLPPAPIQLLTSGPADTDLSDGLHRITRAPLAMLLLERLS